MAHVFVRRWILPLLLVAGVVLFLTGYATSQRTATHPSSGAVSYTLVSLGCVGFLAFAAFGVAAQVRSRRSREQ
jgi:amino acid transporter